MRLVHSWVLLFDKLYKQPTPFTFDVIHYSSLLCDIFSLTIDLPNRIEFSSIKCQLYINLEPNKNGL